MKKKVRDLIQIMGIGISELILDIDLSIATFNSIEYVKIDNKIYLYIFDEDYIEIQLSFDFDNLTIADKKTVLFLLSAIAYN